ncbi:hypothetical protein Peur_028635 [Populus x canadensis]
MSRLVGFGYVALGILVIGLGFLGPLVMRSVVVGPFSSRLNRSRSVVLKSGSLGPFVLSSGLVASKFAVNFQAVPLLFLTVPAAIVVPLLFLTVPAAILPFRDSCLVNSKILR